MCGDESATVRVCCIERELRYRTDRRRFSAAHRGKLLALDRPQNRQEPEGRGERSRDKTAAPVETVARHIRTARATVPCARQPAPVRTVAASIACPARPAVGPARDREAIERSMRRAPPGRPQGPPGRSRRAAPHRRIQGCPTPPSAVPSAATRRSPRDCQSANNERIHRTSPGCRGRRRVHR